MSSADRQIAVRLGQGINYDAGQTLIAEGEVSTHIYLILQGFVKIFARSGDHRDQLIDLRAPGDTIGEMAALDGQPRSATVRAAEAGSSRRIPQSEFAEFRSAYPEASAAMERSWFHRSRSHSHRRLSSGDPIKVRLAKLLSQLDATYGVLVVDEKSTVLPFALSQPELASLLGSAEPTIQREFRDLRRAGIIDTGYRKVVITDRASLHVLAGYDDGRVPTW